MPLPATSTRRLALLLAGLAMFGPFSIDTIFPAFPQLAQRLAVDQVAVQQTVSVYLVAYAVMSLAHGALSDAFGRKRVILGGLVVFVIASAGCALSPDLGTLLAFRALQGFSAGVGMIVGRAVIRDLYNGHLAQKLMSHVSMIFGIAPAIAPIIGGWILGAGAGWPVIFWFLVAFGALLLLATAVWLPETHPPAARTPLSVRGLWRGYATIALDRHFQRLAGAGALTFAGIFLYIASAPVFVLELLHKTEQDFAWLFVPTIGGMTLGAWLSGRMAGRLRPAAQARVGFACCAVASVTSIGYAALSNTFLVPWAVLPILLAGTGMGLVFPIVALAVLDLYPRQRGLASSLQAFTQLTCNAIVAGVLSPLVAHDPLKLSLAASAFFIAGWLCWKAERRAGRRLPRQGAIATRLESSDGA